MKKLFFYFVLLSLLLNGCTLHFKAEKLEVETERQRVQTNDTFHLESIDLL